MGHLELSWERRFIHDSYACRKGKGTHQVVTRLRRFLHKATHNNTQTAWCLQLDVRGFFVAIDNNVLYQRLASKEQDPAVLWLIRQMLLADPADNCLLRGDRRASFMGLPPHKTLFKAPSGCVTVHSPHYLEIQPLLTLRAGRRVSLPKNAVNTSM